MCKIFALTFVVLAAVVPASMAETQPADRTWIYEATGSRDPGVARVDDPDALDGKAMECPPSEKTWSGWYTFVSGYTMDYLPGEYEISYRLKVEDNTVRDILFSLGVENGGVWQHLRGTDFKEAGKYQEFVYPFKIQLPVLNICTVRKHAGPRAWIDRVTVTRKLLYTETQQLKSAEFDRPEELWLIPKEGVQVWFVKGLYYKHYRIHTLLEQMGASVEFAHIVRGQRGSALHGIPLEGKPPEAPKAPETPNQSLDARSGTGKVDLLAEDILTEAEREDEGGYDNAAYNVVMSRDLIVLCNADVECLTVSQRAMIQDFVKAGGGLLVIGGPFAFGRGGMGQSDLLEPLLPVITPGFYDLHPLPKTSPLKPAQGQTVLEGLNWADSPMVMWMHEAQAKPGATVELTAGGKPALVTWQYGKGRVAALTATVLGEPNAGETAFWRWADWPELMENVVQWLMPRVEQ